MNYAVRAYREERSHGITIGHVVPIGYDNHVAEIILADAEIDPFIAAVQAARQRAREAPGRLDEPMPGAYENWEQEQRPQIEWSHTVTDARLLPPHEWERP